MKPTIKITFDSEDRNDEIFYISYEELIEMIEKKTKLEDIDIIDVEVFG
jgi:hypothetical protein